MSGGTREPAGLLDLIRDAAGLDLQLSERLLRDWHRRGLIGSPRRVSLGQGHGQAPAVYSAEQRTVFIAVARGKSAGWGYPALASVPVWAWLNFGERWTDLDQVRRAMRTAVGPSPRRSLRAAQDGARLLLSQIDLHEPEHRARSAFRDVVTSQLVQGRPDRPALHLAVSRVYEPHGIAIVRGPLQAPITVDTITDQLDARIRGMKALRTATDESFNLVRSRYHEILPEYQQLQGRLATEAGPELAPLFTRDPALQAHEAVSKVLLLLGIEARDHDR